MTIRLYEHDMQAKNCTAQVMEVTEHEENGVGVGVVLDQTVFYAQGGGQPGDVGQIEWEGGRAEVVNTVKGDGAAIIHLLAPGAIPPPVATRLTATLDWERRHRLMRMHTALHLLCSVVNAPVTGGSIGVDKSRLDFDLADSPDKEAIQSALDAAIEADYDVLLGQITDQQLDDNPDLVRTMSVKPPRTGGVIRMVQIGGQRGGIDAFDYQPCGGTHVQRTTEIGRLTLGKVEKKGKQNRRISVLLGD